MPPRDDYAELLTHPTLGLRGFVDVEGRPAIAEALLSPCERATLETRTCPYAGSRRDHALPMNVSALKQMARHWKDILFALAFVRRHHLARSGAPTLNVTEVVRVGYAAAWLPLYLIHREHGPLRSGEIPPFVGGLHKSTIDVASTVQLMVFEALCDARADRLTGPIAPEEISDYAEARGFFIGGHGVCAGPPAMIRDMRGVHAIVR